MVRWAERTRSAAQRERRELLAHLYELGSIRAELHSLIIWERFKRGSNLKG
jgi:hypothetical protein